ncbi:MAG: DapH/DapD/GlmU-related protein [Vulcanimicrobiota bacterium]
MRRDQLIQLTFAVVLYLLGGAIVGVCLAPGLWLAQLAYRHSLLAAALALGVGYFLYGFSLLVVTAALHRGLGLDLVPGRHDFFSRECLRWVLASSLHLLVKVTFMDFLMLSPALITYFRLLGGKLGEGVMINSKYIHDLSLLEVGDGAVIGGEAAISCHVAEKGQVLLAPIKIGKKCLIGQRAIIMPDVEIGDGAVVGASAVVLKGTRIGPGETWVGIPARRLD